MSVSIRIRGLDELVARLRATPKQIQRAARNAIDATAAARQRNTRDTVNRSTGIKKKDINRRLTRTRTKQSDFSARLTASEIPFPLSQYKLKKRKVSKTRQAIAAAVFIDRPPVVIPGVFINPLGGERRLLRRKAGVGRYPVVTPKGLSMAQYLAHIELKRARLGDTEGELRGAFFQKLDDQLKRGRR